jgi:predicted nucleic acid-binding protein
MAVLQQISEGAEVHVPRIWPLEVTNALLKAFRRNYITREELFEYARQLGGLRVRVDPGDAEGTFGQVLALAQRYQLTSYDASYLDLAQRRGIPIATSDGNLIQAATAVKVLIVRV